ncbi:hypothetical protein AQS8620_00744 [Aquimixticola soesokkakensis]|uniref:DnaA N-terminal domain-containing protein n=1 Tax=Aquimixticola soesokkakensis TaxID=1519096 RepID=A0A1Y5RTZ1_9RHOB|nr:hypothetical protein [Aquimixticola soesokkakensis]SLN25431.1 hypothetical protein AQS8620_00744 [Aquimixticola soesokkakensis]
MIVSRTTSKAVGRNASVLKYDLLTAMAAHALALGKHEQRLALRLMALMTARYNWARDELAMGQRDIARVWNVDERTVKREMAKLRAMGWLEVKRQGARGRVTEYGLGIARIIEDTRDAWPRVGPDFEMRMSGTPEEDVKVVPLPVRGKVVAPDLSSGTEWALAQGVLHSEDAGLYAAWVQGLVRESRAGGRLTLRAPTRFHASYVSTHLQARLLKALRGVDEAVSEVVISG